MTKASKTTTKTPAIVPESEPPLEPPPGGVLVTDPNPELPGTNRAEVGVVQCSPE